MIQKNIPPLFKYAMLCFFLLASHSVLAQDTPRDPRAPSDPPSDAAVRAAQAQAEADKEEDEIKAKEAAETLLTFTLVDPACPNKQRMRPGQYKLWAYPSGSGSLAYNCLEWAFCRKTAWASPLNPLNGALEISMRNHLIRENFNLTPVDCSTDNSDPLIMLIWNIPNTAPDPGPGAFPTNDRDWSHAMKRVGGKWSSKNGQAGFHKDINDTDSFLDRHYAVPAGKKRIIRCFKKN